MKRKLSYFLALCALISAGGCSGEESESLIASGETGGTISASSAGKSTDAAAKKTEIAEPDGFSYDTADGSYSEKSTALSDSSYGEAFASDETNGCIFIREPRERQARAGLLTGGEWNDNDNFDFWSELLGQRSDWTNFSDSWRLYSLNRIKVHVSDENGDAGNVTVTLSDNGNAVWTAVTDNTGTAYLFHSTDPYVKQLPTDISVSQNGQTLGEFEYNGKSEAELVIKSKTTPAKNLDLMFVVDTTGSMDDELSYLQAELTGVIERVTSDKQIAVRLCTEFYRDHGDDYTVMSGSFNFNTAREIEFLNDMYSSGGGDYPEAVVEALEAAIYEQDWEPGATQLMFLVLDAPPHYTEENVTRLQKLLKDAAAKGIRIIPVAASGTDEETEFLCRSFAVLTGGTYAFLTDHSGIGNSHLEPTIGYYQVEKLNDMLVRIIESYL